MTRPLLLSNDHLHVGINLYAMVHDFYYPWVGFENHARANNMRHRIGVWTQAGFSWLDDGNWEFSMRHEHRAQIGHTTARCARLGVTLEFSDCVAYGDDVFLRHIHVINASDRKREIRLFLQQAFQISASASGDTAQYLPDDKAILHFKGRRNFVAGAKDQNGQPFSQHAIGLFGSEGREGTYRDAEDGVLAGSAVEFGQVDSVIGFTADLQPFDSTRIEYWIAAGKSQWDAVALHQRVKKEGAQPFFERTARHWHRWLGPAEKQIKTLEQPLQQPTRDSLLILKSHMDHKGAVIASTDTTMMNFSRDSYAYCWPRDACYGLWPLLRLGYKSEIKNFFTFCRDSLHPEGFLLQKFRPDRAPGSSWLPYEVSGRVIPPIQEDETAQVIFLLNEYVERHKDRDLLVDVYDSLVAPAANFMTSYINPHTKLPHASYDLWEEKFLTTTYTTALVYAALKAAAKLAERNKKPKDAVRWHTAAEEMYEAAQSLLFNQKRGYFYKGFVSDGGKGLAYDETIDVSSLYGAFMFGLFPAESKEVTGAAATLEKTFGWQPNGPTIAGRYEYDQYYTTNPKGLGNPWFITSLWIAQHDLLIGNVARARETIEWVKNCMLGTGVLAEQVDPVSFKFTSVAPLAWSQAEFISSVLDLRAKSGTP